MGLAHFSIGTSVPGDRIDLLRNVRVADWEPSETPLEDTFASSALAEGRQLVSHRYLNAIEDIPFHIIAPNQNQVIRWSQDLRRMCRRAREYWDTEHQPNIVYLQAKASCETNMRYAWIYKGDVPKDNDPFGPLFVQKRAPRFWERHLIVERGAWMEDPPGVGTTVAVEGTQVVCSPSFLEFAGLGGDEVDCASDAKLDDLPDNAVAGKGPITVDAWIRPDGWGEGTLGRILHKLSTVFYLDSVFGLTAYIGCAGVVAQSTSGLDEFTLGSWVHVLMTYSETGAGLPAARTAYLSIGGVWVVTYPMQQASAGNYVTDAAFSLIIGNDVGGGRCFDGGIGWVRYSNSIRHSPGAGPPFADFTPPDACTLPDIDANTMGQWIYEGIGTGVGAVANQAGGTAADLTGATWDCDCPHTFGYTPPPVVPTLPEWWDPDDEGLCIWAAYQPKGAANYLASKLDLSGNGNHCADGAIIPTWNAVDGWVFSNAVADYLATTFVCADDQSQTIIVQFTNGAAALRSIFGSSDVGNKDCWINPSGGLGVVDYANGGVASIAPALANGNLGFAGNQGYRNGMADGGAIPGWAGATIKPIWIGATSTAAANQWWGEIQSFVIYDCVLTAAQMLKVAINMAGL